MCRGDGQVPLRRWDWPPSHRCIKDQVEEHCWSWIAVAQDLGYTLGQPRCGPLRPRPIRSLAGDAEHVLTISIHREWQPLSLAWLQEGAQPADDFARALVFAHNVRQDVACLRDIGWFLRQQALRCLGIGENDGQRLV